MYMFTTSLIDSLFRIGTFGKQKGVKRVQNFPPKSGSGGRILAFFFVPKCLLGYYGSVEKVKSQTKQGCTTGVMIE